MMIAHRNIMNLDNIFHPTKILFFATVVHGYWLRSFVECNVILNNTVYKCIVFVMALVLTILARGYHRVITLRKLHLIFIIIFRNTIIIIVESNVRSNTCHRCYQCLSAIGSTVSAV